MSQSPLGSTPANASPKYDDAWSELKRKLRQGGSFSGHERNCAFLNTGEQRFACISGSSGFDFPDDGRALGTVDWDFDGDLDLWIANRNAPRLRFLRNDSNSGNHYVALRLQGRGLNRDAIGARVTLSMSGDSHGPQIRTVRAGHGFLSQSSKWLHFGLGEFDKISGCTVRWPNGETEEIRAVESGQHQTIAQGTGEARRFKSPVREIVSRLEPSILKIPRAGPIRAPLALRVPVPAIDYGSFDQKSKRWKPTRGRSLLINFWSTTCLPCLAELREFEKEPKGSARRDSTFWLSSSMPPRTSRPRRSSSSRSISHLIRA